jgi:alpha-D-ribose 1-methylphosphonate 5-triphosphate synthase subunit PhnL
MIKEARTQGAAIVGIFHDREVRDAVATRLLDMEAAA